MDLYEAQEFFKNQNPGKNITYEFDDNCHRQVEIIFTDGLPHEIHHIECKKVKVNVEGNPPVYVPISPHRFNTTWVAVKEYINGKSDVYINNHEIKSVLDLKDDSLTNDFVISKMKSTGLTKDQIMQKINSLK